MQSISLTSFSGCICSNIDFAFLNCNSFGLDCFDTSLIMWIHLWKQHLAASYMSDTFAIRRQIWSNFAFWMSVRFWQKSAHLKHNQRKADNRVREALIVDIRRLWRFIKTWNVGRYEWYLLTGLVRLNWLNGSTDNWLRFFIRIWSNFSIWNNIVINNHFWKMNQNDQPETQANVIFRMNDEMCQKAAHSTSCLGDRFRWGPDQGNHVFCIGLHLFYHRIWLLSA